MAFGIGINTERPTEGRLRGRQTAIACECWFDSRGQTLPRLFKYEENGEIQTIRDIHVSYIEQKNYAGVSSVEYCCDIVYHGEKKQVKLVFFKEECRWVMLQEN